MMVCRVLSLPQRFVKPPGDFGHGEPLLTFFGFSHFLFCMAIITCPPPMTIGLENSFFRFVDMKPTVVQCFFSKLANGIEA